MSITPTRITEDDEEEEKEEANVRNTINIMISLLLLILILFNFRKIKFISASSFFLSEDSFPSIGINLVNVSNLLFF